MGDRFGSVARRTQSQIERLAGDVRRGLGVSSSERLAMQPVLEFHLDDMVPDAYLAVVEDREMEGAEGRTDWLRPVITLSWSTLAQLARGDCRARMTAAHELGHLLMHTQQPVFYYRQKARDERFDPEWQANTFAAALLMPKDAFRKMKTVRQAMRSSGISRAAALRRARSLNVRIIDDLVRQSPVKKKGLDMHRAP